MQGLFLMLENALSLHMLFILTQSVSDYHRKRKGDNMNDDILRLIRCGYSPDEAYITYYDFIKNYGIEEYFRFLESLENERYSRCG